MKRLLPVLFVAVFAAANIITAATVPAQIGPFLVTWGTWIIGSTFFLRDGVQMAYGRRGSYVAIGVALLVAAVSSALLGDTLWIVAASAVSIGLSESLDTEVFTRLRARISTRIAISGVAGSILDSGVFVVLGLSPLTTGIVPWELVPNVIVGQILAKSAVQFVAAALWHGLRPDPVPATQ